MTEKGSEAKVKEAYDDLKKASQVDQENIAKKKYPIEKMLPSAAVIAEYYDMYDQVKKAKYDGPNPTSEKFFKYALDNNKNNLESSPGGCGMGVAQRRNRIRQGAGQGGHAD